MLNKLDDREKLFVIGAVILFFLVLFSLTVSKVVERRTALSDSLLEARGNFARLDKAIQDYNYYRSLKSGDEIDVTSIYAKLDQILIRYGLKERVNTQKDSSTIIKKEYNKITIDISLRSVKLADVFKMIYDIEVMKQINSKVDYMNFIKPLPGKEEYDVNIRFSSFTKVKK
ncbi:MAG: hypothetical protein KBF93_09125 [Leptospiraceae bacterium]|nr:hypothetical protein [Leptospiraceae bacterium]